MNRAENDKDRERKKKKINYNSRKWEGCGALTNLKRLGLNEYDTKQGDKGYCNYKGQEHYFDKLTVGDIELRIEIQVLRVSKRGEHSAEICGNVLHNVGKGHILFLARGVEHEITEGQEGQKRHIVGNKHRADKGYIDEGENSEACVLKIPNYCFGHSIEKAYVAQSAHHRKHAEKAGQGLKIEIVKIFLIRRHDKRRYYRGKCGNKHHGVRLYEAYNFSFHICPFIKLFTILQYSTFSQKCKRFSEKSQFWKQRFVYNELLTQRFDYCIIKVKDTPQRKE